MSLLSISFAIFFVAALALYQLRPSFTWRQRVLALCNLVFVGSQAQGWGIIPLATFVSIGYVGVCLVRYPRFRRALPLAIGAAVGAFVYLKQYEPFDLLPHLPVAYTVVGLSYVLFRILHLLIDTAEGAFPEGISPVDYFNYTCFLFCFPSGPIQRYESFDAMYRQPVIPQLTPSQSYAAISRAVNGLIKVALVSLVLDNAQKALYGLADTAHGGSAWMLMCPCCLLYLVYLYANFSGYMDIVIGLATFFGFTLPENFNHPFAASGFLDLWARWHITLSDWFRYYMFNPLVKMAKREWRDPRATIPIGVGAYTLTFLVMGLWHGSTPVFLWYGCMLGLGAGVNKCYDELMRKRLGKQGFRQVQKHWAHQAFSNALTMGFFAVALMALWTRNGQLQALPIELGTGGQGLFHLLMLIPACAALYSLVKLPAAGLLLLYDRAMRSLRKVVEHPVSWQLGLGLRACALFLTLSRTATHLPGFVYKAF